MNIPKLVEEYRLQGYEITLDGDDFIIKPTKNPLLESQKAVLTKYKQEIIKYLRETVDGLRHELKQAGVSEKWQGYLLERVEILVEYEDYSREEARAEVIKMIPYYNGTALAKSKEERVTHAKIYAKES